MPLTMSKPNLSDNFVQTFFNFVAQHFFPMNLMYENSASSVMLFKTVLELLLAFKVRNSVPMYIVGNRLEEWELVYKKPKFAKEFKKFFRLEQETFIYLISQIKTYGLDAGLYSIEIQLMVFLRLCASGDSYSSLQAFFDIPLPTIGRIINRIANIILKFRKKVIYFPYGEQDDIANYFKRFLECDEFNMIAGCLDGKLCCIKRPKQIQNPNTYRTRKSTHAINVQAICNHKKEFIYVFAGYPGSCHDSWVWRNSACYTKNLWPPTNYCLLADNGYFMCDNPCVIVPYKKMANHETVKEEERRFNSMLKEARKFIEMAFGITAQRWRILLKKSVDQKLKLGVKIIFICFMLHNICSRRNDAFQDVSDDCDDSSFANTNNGEESEDDGDDEVTSTVDYTGRTICHPKVPNRIATEIRRNLTNYLSRIPREASIPHLNDHRYFQT